MKKFLAVLTVFISLGVSAQNTLTGRVLEATSMTPLDYATVAVYEHVSDALITGITTNSEGKFNIQIDLDNVYVEVSFMGFEAKKIAREEFVNGFADLGDILLSPDKMLLEEIEITAEKSSTVFKLDKRVFNVGKDLSSTGASALEVLNNVPSVNVSIEGDISLRGASGVQILINGKPSVIANESSSALGTITADMIESIEVITNPSAKYEAEGTAGILNIILKKEEKKGINGSVSLNTGIPHNHSIGFSLNKRTENFNLFTQLGAGYRELPNDIRVTNIDRVNNTMIKSIGEEFRNEMFYNIILGSDYYLNEMNVLTLSGSFTYEVEDQPSNTSFMLFENDALNSQWQRTEVTTATNPKLQYELQYKRDFQDSEDHILLFSAIGNYFGKEQTSEFNNEYSLGGETLLDQLTDTKFDEGKFTFNLDYTKPFNDKWTLEVGSQYLANDVSNDYQVQNINESNELLIDSGLTNVFDYNKNVFGVYGTISNEGNKWGYKLGLRAENSDLKTELINTQEQNDRNFVDWFPSIHTSYKMTETVSFQAGYSRRIFRPRLWDLNPFFNIRNTFNIRTGNPNLLPEYSDSYETGVIFILENASLNTNVYHRYTTQTVERVSTFEDGVTTWTPQNIGTNKATGVEFNFKYTPFDKIAFNGDINYNTFNRNGSFNEQIFDFTSDQLSGKLTTKFKFSKALDAEITSQYESKVKTIQGEQEDNLYADLGLRYKLMDGKGVFNFSVRDLFESRSRRSLIENVDYYSLTQRDRGRFITLGFSYGFGDGEAMQYSGGRRR